MWEIDWTITQLQKAKTPFQSIHSLCTDLEVSLLSNFEWVPDAMPSSAAIGSAKNKYGAQLHTGNREQLSLFTDQCSHLCWKPLICCLYHTNSVVIVQLSPYVQPWQALCVPLSPLLSFRFAPKTIQEQYAIASFRIYTSFKPLNCRQHWGRAMSPEATVHGTVASEALRPASPKRPRKSDRLSVSHKLTGANRNMWLWWNPGKLSWP